ncbi:glucosaminidase domain-containing protein [Brumimicrobium aurantiacum]|uniref:Peptidoglycan hydrolase n=1 Tax=Brumimicrobium aurantiacum TaxID=1737063 RepID=A0A3E1EZ55_9FLAO|nr:glucosaminidase domain-containing protein [Brumimicrobium aurantiacum]RFC54828.1 LysM peptidoglycan-binding domain-containing protein [Brumimicrobium aurantiacum]
MTRLIAFTTLIFISFSALSNNTKTSLEDYIQKWKDVAMNQMLSHGIPASITLSQGILESGFGNSTLAVEANNHFGIKCHDWKGKTIYKDDDKKNECFRKYDNAAQSYEDHSKFLTSRSRYASLFELEITDYKAWAHGLKDAGYATNPKYPKRLIDLIERYNLDQYDVLATSDWIVENNQNEIENKETPTGSEIKTTTQETTNVAEVTAQRKVYKNNNRTKYVIAGKNDTFYLIAKEFGYSLRQMNRWNDFPPHKDVLKEGDKVYIMRKRKKIKSDVVFQDIKQNKELWIIAQEHGIQLSSLLEHKTQNKGSIALSK